MNIELRFGRWQDRVVLLFDEETGAALGKGEWSGGTEPVMDDGKLVIVPGGNWHLNYHPQTYGLGWPWVLPLDLKREDDPLNCLPQLGPLPLCGLTRLEAPMDDDGTLWLTIPRSIDLAWPSTQFRLTPEQWYKVMLRRFKAAIELGRTNIPAPKHVRQMSGIWAAALKEAQAVNN